MSNLQVRIPKPVILGVFLSFVAWVAAGLLINWIERSVPTTAYHQLYEFIKINNNNPAVSNSQLHRDLAPQIATFDSFVATPVSLLLAGLVYGLTLRKLTWPQSRIIRAAAIVGMVFTGLITAMVVVAIRYLPLLAANITGGPAPQSLPTFTAQMVQSLSLQTLLGIAAYTVGGWLGTLNRRANLLAAPSSIASPGRPNKTKPA